MPYDPRTTLRYFYVRYPVGDTLSYVYVTTEKKDHLIVMERGYTGETLTHIRTFKIYNHTKKELLNETLFEESSFGPPQTTKGEVVEYSEMDEGKRFNGIKSIVSFVDRDNFKTLSEFTDSYLKDTMLVWENREINALIFEWTSIETRFINYLPVFNDEIKSTGRAYYAKGIGFFGDDYQYEGDSLYSMRLIRIEKAVH
jgi:hypothetical protein